MPKIAGQRLGRASLTRGNVADSHTSFRRRRPDVAKEHAEFVVCAMVGALTISRMVTDPELSDAILHNTRKRLVAL